jgi:hypothetical protein
MQSPIAPDQPVSAVFHMAALVRFLLMSLRAARERVNGYCLDA